MIPSVKNSLIPFSVSTHVLFNYSSRRDFVQNINKFDFDLMEEKTTREIIMLRNYSIGKFDSDSENYTDQQKLPMFSLNATYHFRSTFQC